MCAGCVCACVCRGCANECCAPRWRARGVWGLRGERVTPRGARPRVLLTPARTPTRDSAAAGRELQPWRTSPRRPRGREKEGFSRPVFPCPRWSGGPGWRDVKCVTMPPPPPHPHPARPHTLTATATHKHTRTATGLHSEAGPLLKTLPDPPREDPGHWGDEAICFAFFPLLLFAVLFLTVEGEGGG